MLLSLTNGSKQHLKLPVIRGGCGCTTIFFHHHHGIPTHQYPHYRHSSTLVQPQPQPQQRLLQLRLSSLSSSSRRPLSHQIHSNNNHSILPPLRQHPQLQRIHVPPPPKSTRYLTTTTTSTKHTNETTKTSSSSSRHVLLEHLTRKSDDETLKEDVDATPTISILTLNRPEAANAMGHQMIQELQEYIEQIEQQLRPSLSSLSSSTTSLTNTATRCVILTSASYRVFSAGADLKERSQMTLPQAEIFVTALRDTFHRLSQIPIPIIAAIEGAALGGGLELALAADIRIASEHNSVFGLPETSLAIVPGAGGTQRLSRLMGIARAKEMIFTGQRIASRTAYQYGLIQHVVPDGTTLSFATDMAWTIASNGPMAIQAAKHAIDTGYESPNIRDALNIERIAYERVLQSQDRLEGLLAFKEKRKPHYKGR